MNRNDKAGAVKRFKEIVAEMAGIGLSWGMVTGGMGVIAKDNSKVPEELVKYRKDVIEVIEEIKKSGYTIGLLQRMTFNPKRQSIKELRAVGDLGKFAGGDASKLSPKTVARIEELNRRYYSAGIRQKFEKHEKQFYRRAGKNFVKYGVPGGLGIAGAYGAGLGINALIKKRRKRMGRH